MVDRSMSNLKEIEDLESNLSMQKLEVDGKAKEIEKHHQQIASLDTLIQKVFLSKHFLNLLPFNKIVKFFLNYKKFYRWA